MCIAGYSIKFSFNTTSKVSKVLLIAEHIDFYSRGLLIKFRSAYNSRTTRSYRACVGLLLGESIYDQKPPNPKKIDTKGILTDSGRICHVK